MAFEDDFDEVSLPTPVIPNKGRLIVGYDTFVYYLSLDMNEVHRIDAFGNDIPLYTSLGLFNIDAMGISPDGSLLILVQSGNNAGNDIITLETQVAGTVTTYAPPGPASSTFIYSGGNIVVLNNTNFYVSVRRDFAFPITDLQLLGITLNNDNTWSINSVFTSGFQAAEPSGVTVFNGDYYYVGTTGSVTQVFTQNSGTSPVASFSTYYKDIIFVEAGQGLTQPYFFFLTDTSVDRYDTGFNFVDSFTLTGAGINPESLSYSNSPSTSFVRFYIAGDNLRKLFYVFGGSNLGGDPHIKPILGTKYSLPNEEKCYKLFDNLDENRLVINCKCWFLPKNIYNDASKKMKRKDFLWNTTYIRYIYIKHTDDELFFDMENLEQVDYTNDDDFNSYNLKIIKNKINYENIKISDILESQEGIYSITHNKYISNGKSFKRIVEIDNKTCKLTLNLQLGKETEDRNNISITMKSNKEISEYMYDGALIKESANECPNIFFTKVL